MTVHFAKQVVPWNHIPEDDLHFHECSFFSVYGLFVYGLSSKHCSSCEGGCFCIEVTVCVPISSVCFLDLLFRLFQTTPRVS